MNVCKECGCTDDHACITSDGPCYWVNEEEDLCNACVEKEDFDNCNVCLSCSGFIEDNKLICDECKDVLTEDELNLLLIDFQDELR